MWTGKGVSVLGSQLQQYQIAKNALEEVTKKLNDEEAYGLPYAGSEEYYGWLGIDSEQEYYEIIEKLKEQQYEYAQIVNDTEQSVIEMYESQIDAVEEYTNTLVDSYNDYIDVVKEALDAERDLYDFKKNIEKQTKDIGQLERRIASLSGSDDAADIAERRKLEAELYDAREGLNDTYYDHAKDTQSEALDKEAEAYEESMNRFVEGLRTSLDTALVDINSFMGLVTNAVVTNAPTIKEQYESLGLSLDSAIIDPWTEASNAMGDFSGEDGLGVMNSWVTKGGAIYDFSTNATQQLKSPWEAGTLALDTFKGSVTTKMGEVYQSVKSNISDSLVELNNLKAEMEKINTTTVKPPATGSGDPNEDGTAPYGHPAYTDSNIKKLQEVLNTVFMARLTTDGIWGPRTEMALREAQSKMKIAVNGKYDKNTKNALLAYIDNLIKSWKDMGGSSAIGQGVQKLQKAKNTLPPVFHAKGTLGTTKDKLAVTDESWIGEEITLAAGKNGQLQYLKKGSAVMPADISANLVEWGKLNPDMMNIGGVPNFNMISNAINKPEFNLSFDALVKADRIDEGTLPEIKKYVTQEINSLVKQMNYAIKGYAR